MHHQPHPFARFRGPACKMWGNHLFLIWFMRENAPRMDDLGLPLFQETSIFLLYPVTFQLALLPGIKTTWRIILLWLVRLVFQVPIQWVLFVNVRELPVTSEIGNWKVMNKVMITSCCLSHRFARKVRDVIIVKLAIRQSNYYAGPP